MVFRGKAQSGSCDNCLLSKKRCGMEKPSCARCVKQKKKCTGGRDITQLMFQDESEHIRRRLERREAKRRTEKDRSSLPVRAVQTAPAMESQEEDTAPIVSFSWYTEPSVKPSAMATDYFFQQFTSSGRWDFMRTYSQFGNMEPCLQSAIRACGMAALTNVHPIQNGENLAKLMHVDALRLLNQALQRPEKAVLDETLAAVALLAYYENIMSDGQTSIQTWQAHVNGISQLLRLRGKQQFQTSIGRALFREACMQILTRCIWNYQEAPAFLSEYLMELDAHTSPNSAVVTGVLDDMLRLGFQYARVRHEIYFRLTSDLDAATHASYLERQLIEWSAKALDKGSFWQYTEVSADDAEHLWDGRYFLYSDHPAPGIWNAWRCWRIMLSREQEELCRRIDLPTEVREEQLVRFRNIRRQMTNDICATIPACLDNLTLTSNQHCRLISSYTAMWPLFLAGTCAVERIGYSAWARSRHTGSPPDVMHSTAFAQASWILGRLEYISRNVGLKWADRVAGPLRGEFRLIGRRRDEYVMQNPFSWELELTGPHRSPIEDWVEKRSTKERSPWLETKSSP
jgi:hypothetical protein